MLTCIHTFTGGGVRFASIEGTTLPGMEKKKVKKKGVRVLVPEEGGGGEKAKAAGVKSKDKKANQAPQAVSYTWPFQIMDVPEHPFVHMYMYMYSCRQGWVHLHVHIKLYAGMGAFTCTYKVVCRDGCIYMYI